MTLLLLASKKPVAVGFPDRPVLDSRLLMNVVDMVIAVVLVDLARHPELGRCYLGARA